MNVSMNAVFPLVSGANARDDVGMSVLKKAIDVEAQGAMALINAIPHPPAAQAANLPPNLGRHINTTA